jgi:acetyl-CoA carboxylase biotin carboxyl carrier protein
MDAVEQVRQLIEIMGKNDLEELEIEQPDLRVKIRKRTEKPAPQYFAPGFGMHQVHATPGYHPALQPGQAGAAAPEAEAAEEVNDNLLEVTSPMVGTFYRSSTPDGEPYVGIGSEVTPDDVVCIIEAMKVMNEIKAEVEGRIVEILVQDTEPVEFGQVLFLVEPAE